MLYHAVEAMRKRHNELLEEAARFRSDAGSGAGERKAEGKVGLSSLACSFPL
jgi:hypothetical protein